MFQFLSLPHSLSQIYRCVLVCSSCYIQIISLSLHLLVSLSFLISPCLFISLYHCSYPSLSLSLLSTISHRLSSPGWPPAGQRPADCGERRGAARPLQPRRHGDPTPLHVLGGQCPRHHPIGAPPPRPLIWLRPQHQRPGTLRTGQRSPRFTTSPASL